MQLTYERAIRLHRSLSSLDNGGKFVVDDERVPSRIAINLNRLEPHIRAHEKRQKQLRKEVFGHENPITPADPKLAEWSEKMEALAQTTIQEEIKILQCKLADLKVKENQISGPVLAGLEPMISDFESE